MTWKNSERRSEPERVAEPDDAGIRNVGRDVVGDQPVDAPRGTFSYRGRTFAYGPHPGPLMQNPAIVIFVSFLSHIIVSVVLTCAILLTTPETYSEFDSKLLPYWPMLRRLEPYLLSVGRPDAFLYAGAAFSKDVVLLVLFFAINAALLARLGRRISFRQWSQSTVPWYLVWVPLALFGGTLLMLLTGPANIPDHSSQHMAIFNEGNVSSFFWMDCWLPVVLFLLFVWVLSQLLVSSDAPQF